MGAVCLGNRMSLQVPATNSGGPSGDTGERVSFSQALKESSTNLDYRKECLFDCPDFKECRIYVRCIYPELYIIKSQISR